MEKPLVSVIMLTYNHERFISDAILGVVTQVTSFKYELIIGDDCSTDDTAIIIKDYVNRYPNIIKAVLRDKNVGPLKNYRDLIKKSEGKYVAICDGDDYWVDKYKLSKQIEFLENHKEFVACCHPVKQIFDDKSSPDSILDPLKLSNDQAKIRGYLNIEDLIKINSVPSVSVVYRWSISKLLPEWMDKYFVADYPTLLFHADVGNVGVINDVMAVYRRHDQGVWNNHNQTKKQINQYISLLKDIDKELDYRHHNDFVSITNQFSFRSKIRVFLIRFQSLIAKTKQVLHISPSKKTLYRKISKMENEIEFLKSQKSVSNKPIDAYIYGTGGHAGVVAYNAKNNGYQIIGYIDDFSNEEFHDSVPVFKKNVLNSGDIVFLAFGDNKMRVEIGKELLSKGVVMPNLVDHSAIVAKDVILGQGVYVGSNAVIDPNCKIGDFSLINNSACICHDSIVSEGVHMCPMSVCAGHTTIGMCSWIGVGSTISDHCEIAPLTTLGAGTVVIDNIIDKGTYVGVPARKIK